MIRCSRFLRNRSTYEHEKNDIGFVGMFNHCTGEKI